MVEIFSKNHKKSQKIRKKLKKYFWSKKMSQNGPKWPKMAKNRSTNAQNGLKWPKIGQKWKIIKKGRKNVKKSIINEVSKMIQK